MVKLALRGHIMDISVIIGNNIKKLMERENLSFRKLSEIVGVSHPTLIKYVEGTQPIDSAMLMKIAHYFNKPFDYFFKVETNAIRFLFRADKTQENISELDINNIVASVRNYVDIVGEEASRVIPPKYNIPKGATTKEINEFVAEVARQHRRLANIENIIPTNYYEVIQNLGINVIVKPFNNDNYFGASSLTDEYGSYIFINDSPNIPEERKIYSLIHEYAHLLFHADEYRELNGELYRSARSSKAEQAADKFAGYFLLPRNIVDAYVNSGKRDAYEMKKHFQVSLQALYYALHEYKHISKEQYNRFWQRTNGQKNKKIEPYPIEKIDIKDKNVKLFDKMKELYLRDDISANKISELLGTDSLTTRKILQEWRNLDERILPLW